MMEVRGAVGEERVVGVGETCEFVGFGEEGATITGQGGRKGLTVVGAE